jgi:hypothetical protein
MPSNSAVKRYNHRVLVLSILYVLLLLGAEWLLGRFRIAAAAVYAVALLPALPIVGIFVAIGRYLVEERDEYLRMLMVRQALIATGLTLAVATIWGFLESFGLVPHVEAYYIAVLWFFGLGVGAFVNRVRP